MYMCKVRTLVLVLLLVGVSVSCGRVDTRSVTASQGQAENRDAKQKDEQIEIESVQFFSRRGKGTNKGYVQLKRLEARNESRLTIPETFDVITVVKNKGRSSIQYGGFILLTTLDFIVAPNASLSEADKIIKEYSWSRDALVDDVKLGLVPFTETNTAARVEFKGFDLTKSNKVLNDSDAIERVWAVKVTVHVLNRNMVEVTQRDAVITIAH